jgi:glycosyltransferase involved in cell wall biosynthesis
MISHSYYECDNRVRRYAEALAERGDSVDVLALRRRPDLHKVERINGVRVHRIVDRFGKTGSSPWSYLWPLLRFLALASAWLLRRGRQVRYDLLHVHNVPDFVVFAALPARMRGSRVILDIHDILPEFFASKFGQRRRIFIMLGLRVIEKVSAAMSDRVILANDLWLERYATRSARKDKCAVLINYVDQTLFHRPVEARRRDAPLVVFPGGLQWHQGIDIAIRAFAILRQRLPAAQFHIYGDGDRKPQLIALVAELALTDRVRFFEPLPTEKIVDVMAGADLGVVPKRADSFGNEAYSTKILEFMALGVPVVVSDTAIDRLYFDDAVVRFFPSGDHEALARAMFEVLTDEPLRERMIHNGIDCAARNSWACNKSRYLALVDTLVRRAADSSGTMATSCTHAR